METTTAIDTRTEIGAVHLDIAELDTALEFYQQVLGLQLLEADGHTVCIGVTNNGSGRREILTLTENKMARPPGKATGMYHFAIRVPNRA